MMTHKFHILYMFKNLNYPITKSQHLLCHYKHNKKKSVLSCKTWNIKYFIGKNTFKVSIIQQGFVQEHYLFGKNMFS